MAESELKTVKDLIYYQYARIIARIQNETPDGIGVKLHHYGLVKSTFRSIKYNYKTWKEVISEDKATLDGIVSEKKCAYCGNKDGELTWEQIVPKSFSLKPECTTCENIKEVQYNAWTCSNCKPLKNKLGLYDFYRATNPENKLFYDVIPMMLEKKYLKTIYYCHECAGTLDKPDLDGDGRLTVLDIDHILH